jgi:hypothetical protein
LRTRLDNKRWRCRIAYNRDAPLEKSADVEVAGIRLMSADVAECYREELSKKSAKEKACVGL